MSYNDDKLKIIDDNDEQDDDDDEDEIDMTTTRDTTNIMSGIPTIAVTNTKNKTIIIRNDENTTSTTAPTQPQTSQRSNSISLSTTIPQVIPKGKLTFPLFYCLVICISGSSFQVGWAIGVLNTPVMAFRTFYNKTNQYHYSKPLTEIEWNGLWAITNGLLPLGACFGALCSGYMADYFGRLKALYIINSLVLISGFLSVLSVLVKSIVPFIFGRLLTGIMCGLFTGIGPLYLTEIAPRNLRGAAGTLHQLAYAIGVLCTNICGLPNLLGTVQLWPYLYALTLLPALVHVFFLPFCMETPKYVYIKCNNPVEAEQILKKLRGESNADYIKQELEELRAEHCVHVNQKLVSFKDLFKVPIFRRPLIVTVVVQIAQVCSSNSESNGSSFKLSLYLTGNLSNFVASARFGLDPNTWAEYATLIVDGFKILLTLVCVLLVEVAGRRILLLVGNIGMCVSCLFLAIVPLVAAKASFWLEYLTISSTVSYVMFYSIGPGPIAWLITSELFGSNARGKAISIAITVHWLSYFIVSVSIPLLLATIQSYMYLIFVVLIMIFIVFIYYKVPETKNRKIDEICLFFKD